VPHWNIWKHWLRHAFGSQNPPPELAEVDEDEVVELDDDPEVELEDDPDVELELFPPPAPLLVDVPGPPPLPPSPLPSPSLKRSVSVEVAQLAASAPGSASMNANAKSRFIEDRRTKFSRLQRRARGRSKRGHPGGALSTLQGLAETYNRVGQSHVSPRLTPSFGARNSAARTPRACASSKSAIPD
jgi:hypothetical protein